MTDTQRAIIRCLDEQAKEMERIYRLISSTLETEPTILPDYEDIAEESIDNFYHRMGRLTEIRYDLERVFEKRGEE